MLICHFFVLSFDESLNNVIQKEQIDLQICYRDNRQKKVCPGFLDSYFFQPPNAKNLCDVLISSLKGLIPERLIQLSIDGPSTNWNILQLLQENQKEKEHPAIINIGSCGIHILHGTLKVGMEAADWDVGKVLKSMWHLFHDSPARRETYSRVCKSDEFPLK